MDAKETTPDRKPPHAKRRRLVVTAAIFLAPALFLPQLWCGRGAGGYYEGRRESVVPLADEVARWVEGGVSTADFQTGSDLFDAEWQFGTYQMAVLGLSQVVEMHPETLPRYRGALEASVERLLGKELAAFDSRAWHEEALASLDGDKGHAAYLGYTNLALGVYRRTTGDAQYADLHRRITEALARRIEDSPIRMIETYPGETYPVDNSAVAASIALYDEIEGTDHGELLKMWTETFRGRYIDAESGLLYQCIEPDTGAPVDKPRASGTALAAYFLSFADVELSREMTLALSKECGTSWIGFGLVREYPSNVAPDRGDIDSGPVILGMSFSGTGFQVAGARIHGQEAAFRRLYRTVYLVGSPASSDDRKTFACGGPLGNAIMLAMLTAGGAR